MVAPGTHYHLLFSLYFWTKIILLRPREKFSDAKSQLLSPWMFHRNNILVYNTKKSDSNDSLSSMIDQNHVQFLSIPYTLMLKFMRQSELIYIVIYIMKIENDACLMKSQRRKLIKVTWKRHTSLLITVFKLC